MLKASLPCEAVYLFSHREVHAAQVAGVVAEKLEESVFVDAGICSEVVAVDALEEESVMKNILLL